MWTNLWERGATKGLIGCTQEAILSPIPAPFSALGCVWMSILYHFSAPSHSSSPLRPAWIRLLDSHFPRDAGRHDAPMIQRPMCHTLKTPIYACNQTRSHLVLDQQQRQPNITECKVWACISPSWTGSLSRLSITKATNHPQVPSLATCVVPAASRSGRRKCHYESRQRQQVA